MTINGYEHPYYICLYILMSTIRIVCTFAFGTTLLERHF